MINTQNPSWMGSLRDLPSFGVHPNSIHSIAKQRFRRDVGAIVANKFEDLANRIAAWKNLPEVGIDETPVTPGQEKAEDRPEESRPELEHLKPWRGDGSGRERAIQQAQALIDENLKPFGFDGVRSAMLSRAPGPGISPSRPGAIRW